MLKFTPLEFETFLRQSYPAGKCRLKFTPLEFETYLHRHERGSALRVKIYSVGVWNW